MAFIAIFVVGLLLSFVVLGNATANGNVKCVCPTCGGEVCDPGGCPGGGQVQISNIVISTSATNATVRYELTPTTAWTTSWVLWGNVSVGIMFNASDQPLVDGYPTAFINYLEPTTTYDYEIIAFASGCGEGTYARTFATTADVQNPTYISGTVYDMNGAKAGPNVIVEAGCANNVNDLSDDVATTNQIGQYTVAVPTIFTQGVNVPCPSGGGILVTVDNWGFVPPGGSGDGWVWSGHWNETIIVWAPQSVNFYLPMNYVGPWTPQVIQFSNAPAGYSTIGLTQTTTFTTGYSDSFGGSGGADVIGVGGGISYKTTTTSYNNYTSSATLDSVNGSLEVLDWFWTSGTVEFDSLNRAWTVVQETQCNTACGGEQEKEQGSQYIPSWLKTGSQAPGMHELYGYKQVYLSPGEFEAVATTATASTATNTQFAIQVGISVTLNDVATASLGVGLGWSTSTSTSYTNDLSWTIGGTATTDPECFDVYGQAGSASADTATVIGLDMYGPSGGVCN
jgi:hypothetical protein